MAKYRQGCQSGPRKPSKRLTFSRPSTIVACPGRLNDFLEGGQVRIDGVLKLILDEVA